MREDGPRDASAADAGIRPLIRSRFAVRCIFAFCVLASVLSVPAFVFHFLYRNEFGDLFRHQPGAWPFLLGHLLRCAVGAALAWCLWRYLQAVKKSMNPERREAPELFQSLADWWNVFALSGLALVLYGVWVGFIIGPPVISRPLSPSFPAEPFDTATVKVEIRLAETVPREGLIEATVADTSQKIFLSKEPLLANQDIAEARVVLDEFDEPGVQITFVPAVHQKVREATESHRGKPLAILVDGRVVTAPIVQWQIGESALIQGGFRREEAERIAKGLSGRK